MRYNKTWLNTFCLIVLLSCEKSEKYVPQSVGPLNSIGVVAQKTIWEQTQDSVKSILEKPLLGTPTTEPIFNLHFIPENIFKGPTRNNRNLLIFKKDTNTQFVIRNNIFAKPQKIAYLKAPNTYSFFQLLNQHQDSIIHLFKQNEFEESKRRIYKVINNNHSLQKDFSANLSFPNTFNSFKIVKGEFHWYKRELRHGSSNLIVYKLPLDSFNKVSSSLAEFTKLRDTLGKKHIPGREPNMYMVTEKEIPIYTNSLSINGVSVLEYRGLWYVKNFLMGGPFITYLIYDKKNNQTLYVEGFVFSPSVNKRNYLFEIETIVRSLNIP